MRTAAADLHRGETSMADGERREGINVYHRSPACAHHPPPIPEGKTGQVGQRFLSKEAS